MIHEGDAQVLPVHLNGGSGAVAPTIDGKLGVEK
jgi:hypothetical protein